MSTTSGTKKELPDSELRALYDIRVKEAHHYNTTIWAFPIAYAGLLAAETRFLDAGSWHLVTAAIFNIALWYVFWRHLQNKQRVQTVLLFTEKKLGELYGSDFVPVFPDPKTRFPPKATTVMNWLIIVVTALFAARAIHTLGPCCAP